MATYKIANVGASTTSTKKCLNIYGSNLTSLSDGINVTLWSDSGSNEQKWEVSSLENGVYVKSVIDTSYGLNVYRSGDPYNCNIHKISGNETDAKVNFVADGNYYKIKLTNYNYYLTVGASSDGTNVYWAASSTSNYQKWLIETVPATGGNRTTIDIPSTRTCNWNQFYTTIVNTLGSEKGCPWVCGLDVANIYGRTSGTAEYTPSDMSGSTYWSSSDGYTWKVPSTCKGSILGYSHENSTDAQRFTTIRSEINNNRPVIVEIYNANATNPMHFVVAYGYTGTGTATSQIKVFDPGVGDNSSNTKLGLNHTLAEAIAHNKKISMRRLKLTSGSR